MSRHSATCLICPSAAYLSLIVQRRCGKGTNTFTLLKVNSAYHLIQVQLGLPSLVNVSTGGRVKLIHFALSPRRGNTSSSLSIVCSKLWRLCYFFVVVVHLLLYGLQVPTSLITSAHISSNQPTNIDTKTSQSLEDISISKTTFAPRHLILLPD